jgi:hypothetical protein
MGVVEAMPSRYRRQYLAFSIQGKYDASKARFARGSGAKSMGKLLRIETLEQKIHSDPSTAFQTPVRSSDAG